MTFLTKDEFKIFIIYVRKINNFREMDLKYFSKKISPSLILFNRKYEGTSRHKIHYIFPYHITASP